jgi:LacI family transcriptional regulator, galactose operon repressor
MQRPTLKTIASEMDLSVSAVSRIINGKGKSIGLNDNTIKNTLAFADKIGYRPHKQAQNLRLGKTNTIGVILSMPEPNNSDLSYRLFKGISQTAREKFQTLMFFDIDNTDSALSAINQCMNSGVDGIIATYRYDKIYLERLRELISQGVNIVIVLNRSSSILDCPNVEVDHQQGGFIATEYLIKKGYKRIAHLSRRAELGVGKEHLNGYKKALATSRIPYDEQLVIEDTEDINFDGAKELLKLKELPDAVFCWNDRSAVKAQHIFEDAGVKIKIVGFDNREFIQYMKEPFDSVDFPLQEVGKIAVNTLLSGDLSKRILTISPELINYP